MESAETPVMPDFLLECISMINRMPATKQWKRLRIALTRKEADQLIDYFCTDTKDNPRGPFAVYAIRGVPVVIEEYPFSPEYTMVVR